MAGQVKGEGYLESVVGAEGKRLTANKGTQVTKDDLPPPPKTDREKMPPLTIPQRRREPVNTEPSSKVRATTTSVDSSPRRRFTPTANLTGTNIGPAHQHQVGGSIQQPIQQTSDTETPLQWYERMQRELAGVEAWRPGHPTGGFAGPEDVFAGLDFLLTQAPRGGCAYGCGKPGGEHAVDCPGLNAGHY